MSDDGLMEGWDELMGKLDKLGELPDSVVEKAARAGIEPIVDEANRLAPGPHIVYQVRITRTGAQAKIGPDDKHWYYRFFEYGATAHEIEGKPLLIFEGQYGKVFARKVKSAGGMAAVPFLRPALDHQAQEAIRRVFAVLLDSVVEVANG